MAHYDAFEMVCNAECLQSIYSTSWPLMTPYENRKITANAHIFTRFWPNFGFESHKIARYLVLNVSMAHSDALRQCAMPLKYLEYLQALRTHAKT